MSANANESAFPRVTAYEHPEEYDHYRDIRGECGLTKREWFAGMAMQGLLANPNNEADPFSSAREAADRMLAELAKPESEPTP